MADVQLEDGYTRIANEILEQTAKRKFNGTQMAIILLLWRYTYGFQRKSCEMSLSFISEAISADKHQIKRELNKLIEWKVVTVYSEASFNSTREIGFNKNFDCWEKEHSVLISTQVSKKNTVSEKEYSPVDELAHSPVGELAHQERNIFKETIKENNSVPFSEIIDYLNEKADTKYKPSSKATQKHIHARWSDGYRISDFQTVIEKKCAEWKGTDMEKYLCPDTLFGTKFEKYLNQKVVIHGGRSPMQTPLVTVTDEERERLALARKGQIERNKSPFAINH